MRNVFCSSLVASASLPDFVFLTGDLGYKALEPLRDALGSRFINAGVAEQNMVGVAAGLAKVGLRPWAYSIAPFMFARPFEQIRNDICLHQLPVVLVGNGGGYGYGVMGATHHALEDGILLTLNHLQAFIPAFDEDVYHLVPKLFQIQNPSYFRLGLSEKPKEVTLPPYAPWRCLVSGNRGVIAVVGSLVGGIWDAILKLPVENRPSLWLVSELPLEKIPVEFIEDLQRSNRLLTVEEHVAQGGFGQMLAQKLLELGQAPDWYRSATAKGYPSGRYGSQGFHRRESGLAPDQILQAIFS